MSLNTDLESTVCFHEPVIVGSSTLLLLFSHCVVSDCDTMDCSMPAFLVLYHLPKFAQTHVHWVSDTIQPSRSLLLPSPPAFSLSQHQGLFQCVSSSHQVAKVLELQHQAPSGLISFRTDWFDFLAVQGTLKRLLQHYNLKASILRAQCSLWSNFHIHTWLLEKL